MNLQSQEEKFNYLDADGNRFIDSTDWEEDHGISAQFDNLLMVHDKNGKIVKLDTRLGYRFLLRMIGIGAISRTTA